jgi:molybdopterin converting factor small subunit
MTILKIPSPLRPYAEGMKEIEVTANTVGAIIEEVVQRFPQLQPHLFDEHGEMRPYVNIFLNDSDIRGLEGNETQVGVEDRLMIVPSIAGGTREGEMVDHAALRTNQATISLLLLLAFLFDLHLLVFLVGMVMFIGTAIGKPGFVPVYRLARGLNLVKADPLPDHREPHRFAQGFGSIVLFLGALCFQLQIPVIGWGLTWLVIVLAGVNLFLGFCVGCAMYYWLNRIGVPYFRRRPPEGRVPGMRPPKVNQV